MITLTFTTVASFLIYFLIFLQIVYRVRLKGFNGLKHAQPYFNKGIFAIAFIGFYSGAFASLEIMDLATTDGELALGMTLFNFIAIFSVFYYFALTRIYKYIADALYKENNNSEVLN